MIILIDRTAHGTEGVMAVRQHIRQRELRHAGGPRGLYDAHIGYVMAGHGIESDSQLIHSYCRIMSLEYAIGHRSLPRRSLIRKRAKHALQLCGILFLDYPVTIYQIYSMTRKPQHDHASLAPYRMIPKTGLKKKGLPRKAIPCISPKGAYYFPASFFLFS